MLSKCIRGLEVLLQWVVTAITGILIVIITYQVFGRYVLNSAPSWTEEVGRILLVWIGFLGAALMVRRKKHIRMDFFLKIIKQPALLRGMDMFTEVFIIVFAICMIVLGSQYLHTSFRLLTEALHLPAYTFNASVCVSGMCMLIFAVANLVESLQKTSKKEAAHA